MGQKCSCFGEFGLSRITGKRRRNASTIEIPLESMTYIRNNYRIPNMNPKVGVENVINCTEYMGLNFEKQMPDIKPEIAVKESDKPMEPPKFEVKDGTLILVPTTKDHFDAMSIMPSNISYEIPSAGFGASEESSEDVMDKTFHHPLPYIPTKSKFTFLDRDGAIESNGSLNEGACSPITPPRKQEIILDASMMDPPKLDERDPKVPPEIPPRNFDRYF